jgi:membrane-bound serine protease (ClpP class)
LVLALAIIIALIVPWPWTVLVLGLGAVAEVGEIVWGRRLAKRWRPRTGAESLIGAEAEVVSACRPSGQVRVDGELWAARCAEGADEGQSVRITEVDGLTLVVRPVS